MSFNIDRKNYYFVKSYNVIRLETYIILFADITI